ncbi:hypothetical protein NYO99_13220 [Pelomonas sp. UHG3]|uniref:Uncharacterized protein n=2 Tax=Roseateles hydrophilus TaxID=2975054 RepID=A0ACC6CC71_9BURK|nr:hypothetical protein [Pelomonas sp. UHG3]
MRLPPTIAVIKVRAEGDEMAKSAWWKAVWLPLFLALSVHAQPPESDIVLGRADADASGGWPVVLWVVDGDRASVVVSASRDALGELPGASWVPVDAQALMSLERFGAPQLVARPDATVCPVTLGWARSTPPQLAPYAHWAGERLALRHTECAGGDCAMRQAWRIDLPAGSGESLPLARLLPGLAAHGPEWLVLHVVSRHSWPGLAELRYLAVPPPLAWADAATVPALPLAAAAQFPAIQAELLLQAARAQGRAATSTLMRADAMGSIGRVGYVRNWAGSAAQREALGVQSISAQSGRIARLLLRLHPADRPATLSLMARPPNAGSNFVTLHALVPEPATMPACQVAQAALRCEPACAERVAELQQLNRWAWVEPAVARLTPAARLASCRQSCQLQKQRVEQDMAFNFERVAERQQRAWQWVESLTGRSAAAWQRQAARLE